MANFTFQQNPFLLGVDDVDTKLGIAENADGFSDLIDANILPSITNPSQSIDTANIFIDGLNVSPNPSPQEEEEVNSTTEEEPYKIPFSDKAEFDNLEISSDSNLEAYDTSSINKFEELISKDAELTTSTASDTFADLVENPKGEDATGSGSKSDSSSTSSSNTSTSDDNKRDGSANNLTNSDEDDDLIAGKVMAEARAAVKGVVLPEDAVNLSLKAKNSTKEAKESLDAAQQGSTTERNGKVTEGSEEVLKTANETITKSIDELVESKATNSGVKFSANDAISFSTHKGINLSTSGSITNIAAQKNEYSNASYTASEYSFVQSNLSNTDTNIKVENSKNSISRNVNSLEYSRNREINTETAFLNATEALQTASKERVEVFENGQTQGANYKLSVEKNQVNNIGESYVMSVGSEVPDKSSLPAFSPLSLLSDIKGNQGGYLLTVTPDSYDLQQEGTLNIHSSKNQTYLADSIVDISNNNKVSFSKQNIISYTVGNEYRVSSNVSAATLLGGGTSTLGRFSFMGGLFGMISNVAQIASSLLPGLNLPTNLPLPPIGERPDAGLKVDIDACIPSKYKDYMKGEGKGGSSDDLNGDIAEDLSPEYSFNESAILDDLTKTGNLDESLNNTYSAPQDTLEDLDLGETFNAGPTSEIDTITGEESSDLGETDEALEDPIPSEEELVEGLDEKKPTMKEWTSGRGVETSQGFKSESKTKNLDDISASSQKKSKTGSSLSSSNSNASSKGLSLEKRMKVRFAPHTYFDIFEEEDFEYGSPIANEGEPMDVDKGSMEVKEDSPTELKKLATKSIEDSIESSSIPPSSKDKLKSNVSNVLDSISSLNFNNSESVTKEVIIDSLKSLNLSEEEEDVLYHSYLELNADVGLAIGILGSILPLIQEAANVASNVFSQVSSIASMVGIDIQGGIADSVMSVIDEIKGGLNVSSIASLLDSSGELNKFIPVGQSIIAMLNNPDGKQDIMDSLINNILPQVEGLISPMLSGFDSVTIGGVASGIASLLSEGAMDNMGPEELFFRAQSILNQSNLMPESAKSVLQAIGPLLTSFGEGGSLNQLIGGDILSQISSSLGFDMSSVSNVVGNLEGIVGNVNALLSIPSILDAMNEYDIPLLTQISSAIECVDLFARIKDIIGIVKDPLNYQSQFSSPGALKSLGLPIDSSILSTQSLMSKLVGEIDSSLPQTGIVPSVLGVLSSLKGSIGSFSGSFGSLSSGGKGGSSSDSLSEADGGPGGQKEEGEEGGGVDIIDTSGKVPVNDNALLSPELYNSYNLIDGGQINNSSTNIISGYYSEPRIKAIETIDGETYDGYFSVDELGNIAVKSIDDYNCENFISKVFSPEEILSITENPDLERVEYGTFVPLDEYNTLNPDYNLDGLVSYTSLIEDPSYRVFFEDPELGEFEIVDPSIYYGDIGITDKDGNPLGLWTSGVSISNGGLDIINTQVNNNVENIYDESGNVQGQIVNSTNTNRLQSFNPDGTVSTINHSCNGTFNDFMTTFNKISRFNRFIVLNSNGIFEVFPGGRLRYNMNNGYISYTYSSKIEKFNVTELREIAVMEDNYLLLEWVKNER